MALKQKITKAVYDALSADVKAEYKAGASADEFVLDIDGIDDYAELRRARDREKETARVEKVRADALQKERDDLEAALGGDAEARARAKGDIPTLEKSWKDKQDTAVKAVTTTLTAREDFIRKQLVDSVAVSLAQKISTSPNVMLPHIRSRLTADLTGEQPMTRVLDIDGKVSAMSLDDLEKEFVANADFAGIITASKASGGGATGGKQGAGGAHKKFADMTGVERAEMQKSDPAGFQRESAAARGNGPKI